MTFVTRAIRLEDVVEEEVFSVTTLLFDKVMKHWSYNTDVKNLYLHHFTRHKSDMPSVGLNLGRLLVKSAIDLPRNGRTTGYNHS